MAERVTVSELKAPCLRLLDEVARQRREIVVTKRGKPIARVVPIGEVKPMEVLAHLCGTLIGGEKLTDFETGMIWEAVRR